MLYICVYTDIYRLSICGGGRRYLVLIHVRLIRQISSALKSQ